MKAKPTKRRYRWRIDPEEVRRTRSIGGRATKGKHGVEHYRRMGKAGGRPPWQVTLGMTDQDRRAWLEQRRRTRSQQQMEVSYAPAE